VANDSKSAVLFCICQTLSVHGSLGDFTFWISPWMRPKTETNH